MIHNLAKLKKMHQEKPYLYEEEEHAVLKLAEDAVEFITEHANDGRGLHSELLQERLEEHK